MSGRIIKMRKVLYDALVSLNTPGDWTHITSQIGMFSFTGLTPAQCKVLSQDDSKHRAARIAHDADMAVMAPARACGRACRTPPSHPH